MSDQTVIKPEEARVLKELEQLIGKPIPRVDSIEIDTFGVQLEGDTIVGLGLHASGLMTLPESIGNLHSLQVLHLGVNQLTTIPPSIGQLPSLQVLDLYRNQLTWLPESIGQLPSLQVLNLHGNWLTWLPESIGQLPSLEQLYLAGNQLKTLPEAIGQLPSLQNLRLGGNQITKLPPSIGQLPSLQVLNLYGNWLTTLPESIGHLHSLEELDLGENQLTTLPPSIGQLQNLISLGLDGNTSLRGLDEEAGRHLFSRYIEGDLDLGLDNTFLDELIPALPTKVQKEYLATIKRTGKKLVLSRALERTELEGGPYFWSITLYFRTETGYEIPLTGEEKKLEVRLVKFVK